MSATSKLQRVLGWKEATALNMIDMVGIGPFITLPLVVKDMHGPQCILAWLLGALLSYMDGCVWAELGAAWPHAGGSYVFLRKLYGEKKWGRMFSFLYIWQTSIQAPLVIASGAIGFSQYMSYLFPALDTNGQRLVSGSLVVLLTFLLYRNIKDVGRISVLMWIVVAGTLLWIIIAGFSHFNSAQVFTYPEKAFELSPLFFAGLGMASTKTIYSYLGYYNVCHVGGEIVNPQKNIPRSIFISITGIAILYLLMQVSVLGVVPWQSAQGSKHVISDLFSQLYGTTVADIATVCILFIAAASLFSATLGYSRIPYAAALRGDFFKPFAALHPTKNFPHISLLFLCATAFIFSLFFKLSEVITTIVVMRILVQFVAQAAGLIAFRYRKKENPFPFRMPLFPLPAVLSICIWLFIFISSDWKYILAATGVIFVGLGLFFLRNGNKSGPEEKMMDDPGLFTGNASE
ncbi:MAG TPA: APC family permease [Bacteroidia bacterium]